MLSTNSDSFTFFLIQMPFISYLIALDRTSNIMLNKSGKSGHSWLFLPSEGGKDFSVSSLMMMLPVGLSYMGFTMLKHVPSMYILLRGFFKIINGCWILYVCFSRDTEIKWFLLFIWLMWYISCWFADVKLSLYNWNESHSIMVYNAFDVLLYSVAKKKANILLRLLHLYSSVTLAHHFLMCSFSDFGIRLKLAP